ncbi:MAG TPA: neutral/alkaline non-lysosomal ceramidase N-terminal domain-containing protein [Myxococcaceae bacterium]|nr:neutral/alkaline non-lysosomal ceramidase N-terminal domain-containing protein [Myxococcaceae bacterium]
MQANWTRSLLFALRYLAAALGLAVLAFGVGSINWCRRSEGDLRLLGSQAAQGPLSAGAARVELEPPLPVVIAGYPPQRPEASRILYPLCARALVVQMDHLKLGLVSIDLLTTPDSLVADIRGAVEELGLSALWVTATHSHSSEGGYDRGLLAQLAGTGRYRTEVRATVVEAAVKALRQAAAALAPAALESGEGAFPELVAPRSEGMAPDGRLTRLAFRAQAGPIAQVIIFAAHPTLVPRQPDALSPDYPGLFSSQQEGGGAGITLFLQGGVGNSVAAAVGDNQWKAPSEFADALARATRQVELSPASSPRFAFSRVSVSLPPADASRLAPPWLRGLAGNFVCAAAPSRVEISALQLGPVRLLFLPGEPTALAAKLLEGESGVQRAVALTNGYVGYLDGPEIVHKRIGESRRQYFEPTLLPALAKAGQLAVKKLAIERTQVH